MKLRLGVLCLLCAPSREDDAAATFLSSVLGSFFSASGLGVLCGSAVNSRSQPSGAPPAVTPSTIRPSPSRLNTVHCSLKGRSEHVGESPLFCWPPEFGNNAGSCSVQNRRGRTTR